MSLAMPQARRRMHLRIAVATGGPYAVFMAVWFAVGESGLGVVGSVIAGAVGGVLFGTIMSALLGSWQWRAAVAARTRRRATDPDAPLDLGTRASETVAVTASAADVLRAAPGAAAALGRATVTAVDEDAGTIALAVRTSWQSWGERVVVRAGPGTVTVASRPVVPWTLVDRGRNARHVEALVAWAKAL